jgi:hypothetical protein
MVCSVDHIDVLTALHHLVTAQRVPRVGYAATGVNVELPAMPRANDVSTITVVGLENHFAVRTEHGRDPPHDSALTDGATLVGTHVRICAQFTVHPEDADASTVDVDDASAVLLKFSGCANPRFSHLDLP